MCQIERWMGYEYLPRKKNNNEMKNNNKTKKTQIKKKKPDIGALTKFGIMLNVQVY